MKKNIYKSILVTFLILLVARVLLVIFLNQEINYRVASAVKRPQLCGQLHYLMNTSIDRFMGWDGSPSECYYRYAMEYNFPEACTHTGFPLRKDCFMHFAFTNKDFRLCDFLGSPNQGECYFDLIESGIVNKSECKGIQNIIARTICEHGPYERLVDPEQCRSMESSYFKDNCFQKFGLL